MCPTSQLTPESSCVRRSEFLPFSRPTLEREEDARRLGARPRDVEIGASGEIVVFGFHPIESITTGEGGMIVCRDGNLAALGIRRLERLDRFVDRRRDYPLLGDEEQDDVISALERALRRAGRGSR